MSSAVPRPRPADFDTIVIGAGLGGLTCAAYLAAGGRRPLVLESHDIAGGCAQVFRRRGRYEFDVGAHYLGDYGPDGRNTAILRGLGLTDRVAFAPLDPDGFDVVLAPGVHFATPVGWDRYRQRLAAQLPGEQAAVDTVTTVLSGLSEQVRGQHLGADQGTGDPWSRRTLRDLFEHTGLSARGRTIVGAQALNVGTAPDQVVLPVYAAMLDHYVRGAYHPVGGGQVLVAALVELIEANGGEVRTRTPVARITVERGRATGVVLADGTRLAAPVVVSNADYLHTLRDLVGLDALPEVVRARVGRAAFAMPMFTVSAAVDVDPGWPADANRWVFDSADPDDTWSRLDEVPFAVVTLASGRAVPGHRTVQVMTLLPAEPADRYPAAYRRDAGYLAEKARVTQRLLDLAEQALGPFRGHLVHVESSSARTHTRYTGATGGTPYGLASTVRQYGQLRPGYRSPVEGLFLVGASARAGGGFCGVSLGGVLCAEEILERPLLREVSAGAVLADPERLPTRTPDWDPLRVSRGRARADRRAAPGPATDRQPAFVT